eukprot:3736787-Prymnesium_polylepis.1
MEMVGRLCIQQEREQKIAEAVELSETPRPIKFRAACAPPASDPLLLASNLRRARTVDLEGGLGGRRAGPARTPPPLHAHSWSSLERGARLQAPQP